MRIKKHLLYLLILLSSSVLFGQEKYNIEYITTENGLPSDGIKAMQCDEQNGFLWISTEGGVVRYNGQLFVTFNKENFNYLSSDKIYPFSKKADGTIFGYSGDMILEVKNNKLIPNKKILKDKKTYTDLINIYLSATNINYREKHINDYDRFLPVDANTCLVAKNDTLWKFTSENNNKTFLADLSGKGNYIFKIEKNIFFCDRQYNLYVYDSASQRVIKAPVDQMGKEDTKFPAGKKHIYWEPGINNPIVLAGSDAWELSYKNGKIVPQLICTEIPQNYSIQFAQYWDKAQILFLGTSSKGIIVIRKNYLLNVKKNRSGFDEPNAIYSQILLSNGNVLTNTGDILGPSTDPVKVMPVKGSFDHFIYITSDSILYYAFKDSLFAYSYKTNQKKCISKIAGSSNLVFVNSSGKDYAANKNGIYLIDGDGLRQVYQFNSIGDPFSMAELQPGILAIATSIGLFSCNLSTGKLDTLLHKKAIVRSLWKYKSYLFAGTYGDGIYVLKDNIIKKIPTDNNNYLNYTHCFMLDSSGYCWMSTNRGLFKASLADMLNAYEHDVPYLYYHFFGKNEGMDITEMNGGCAPCGIWLKNNNISFPTMDGALWVPPGMPVRLPDENVFIDQVVVNGKKSDTNYFDVMLFDAGTHDISFNLGFSEWCDQENVYLYYTLDSSGKKWQKIEAQHPVIRLSSLPYGKYTLYIKKLKGFGNENYVIRKVDFEIEAPWFMSWWGKLMIIFVFVAIVVIISIVANRRSLMRQIRLRNLLDKKTKEILTQNEKLEKNDRIKTRLISIISHDIITPLKYLHLTSKYLLEHKVSLTENLQKETLVEVVNTSRELELLSTNILNWIKYQNEERRIVKESINLHDLVEQIFAILISLAHKNNIELANEIPEDTMVTQFVDPLRIIVYNLVVNAINFTKKGSITVYCHTVHNQLQIEVNDTGMGMSKAQINNLKSDLVIVSSANVNKRSGNGLGYLIIKDLLKMINGTFDIESQVNKGTSVFITFPVE